MRRRDLVKSLGLGAAALQVPALFKGNSLRAEGVLDKPVQPVGHMFLAPDDPKEWPAFREALAQWRVNERKRLNYDDLPYRRPEFAWAASAYCSYFLMLLDEAFYDRSENTFKVDDFCARAQREFGGIDSVILWQAYPRIGVDQR